MFYDVKTGRLTFEAADVMINRATPARKRNIIAVTQTKIQRPKAISKTSDNLEKNLCGYKMRFSRESGKLLMKRIIGASEMYGYMRRASLHVIAAMITIVLIYGSVAAIDVRFAHEAIIDGKPVGVITNVSNFEKLIEDMRQSLSTTLGKDVDYLEKPVYIARLVFGKSLTSEYKLRQNILSTFSEVEEAYAIYVNDVLICSALDEDSAKNALRRVKEQYLEEGIDMTVDFADNVSVRKEFIPIGYMRSEDGIFAALTSTSEGSTTYRVSANDTIWGIANKFGMSVDEIFNLNKGLSEIIHEGKEIIITKSDPLLSVKTAYVYEGEKPIPYDVQETHDDTLPSGNKKVVVEGIEGKKHVVEEVVKINGEVVEYNVKSEEILSEPVVAQVNVGTKTNIASGTFSRPVYGTISSRYGRRGRGFHSGIDIAASTGTPIYAADGGTVSFSGWEGGYGYLVKINHGNGYETYYAHCSALLVTVGQKVSKGDLIAKVGNTGNSTGPHCHFEVRLNGATQNPSNYVY